MKEKKINHEFVCKKCHKEVEPHPSSSRNHCNNCLYSQHLDLYKPGDRIALCGGLMKPIDVDYNGKKGYSIIHECEKCHKKNRNKVAADDCWEEIVKLSIIL
jgi:hypothetical protein